VRRGGSLSFLTIFTFAVPELLDLIWRKIGFLPYCRMITWVVFLRMFWNFISSLLVKRGGSLSFLVGTISNVLVMEIGWTDVGSRGYILVSCAHSNTSFQLFRCLKTIISLHISKLINNFSCCSQNNKDCFTLLNCNMAYKLRPLRYGPYIYPALIVWLIWRNEYLEITFPPSCYPQFSVLSYQRGNQNLYIEEEQTTQWPKGQTKIE
jgi:hypothetical protein